VTVPTTFSELKTAIEEDLARSDLTAELPNFVNKGEAILNRRLRLLSMETTASLTLSASASTISLPSGFLEHIGLRYTADNFVPTQVSFHDLDDLKSTASGKPEIYAIGANIEFNQTADQAYTLTQRYYKAWDIATDTTNTLLTSNPDVYLYAGLVASVSRTGPHPRSQEWVRFLTESIGELQKVDGRTRRQRITRVDTSLTKSRNFDINRGY